MGFLARKRADSGVGIVEVGARLKSLRRVVAKRFKGRDWRVWEFDLVVIAGESVRLSSAIATQRVALPRVDISESDVQPASALLCSAA